jgi:hypothetical protein
VTHFVKCNQIVASSAGQRGRAVTDAWPRPVCEYYARETSVFRRSVFDDDSLDIASLIQAGNWQANLPDTHNRCSTMKVPENSVFRG